MRNGLGDESGSGECDGTGTNDGGNGGGDSILLVGGVRLLLRPRSASVVSCDTEGGLVWENFDRPADCFLGCSPTASSVVFRGGRLGHELVRVGHDLVARVFGDALLLRRPPAPHEIQKKDQDVLVRLVIGGGHDEDV